MSNSQKRNNRWIAFIICYCAVMLAVLIGLRVWQFERTVSAPKIENTDIPAPVTVLLVDINTAELDELTELPGIGRKSANVILGNCFDIPGFPVDTHVKRVLNRLGVVNSNSPEKIEVTVNRAVAPELWTNFSHLIIQHGRKVCHARTPACEICVLSNICKKRKMK